MLLSELHIHSTYSDGKLRIPEIVDFFGQRGFGVIAITDHLCEESTFLGKAAAYLGKSLPKDQLGAYFNEIRSEAKRAWKQYGMLVLPGYEITKNSMTNQRSAHLLVLGVESFIQPDQDLLQIAKQVRKAGGLSIAAHPIWGKGRLMSKSYHLWDRRYEMAPYIDAWEITNTGELIPEVVQSSLPKLATGDFHRPSQISSWKTMIRSRPERESVFKAIRKQDLEFIYFDDQTQGLRSEQASTAPIRELSV